MAQPVVGIVGAGTVGGALIAAFRGKAGLLVRDPALDDSRPMVDLVREADAIFVAVPTPMAADGRSDLSAWNAVLGELADAGISAEGPVVCVRSAVPPDAIAASLDTLPGLRLVVGPEFLRERSAVDDMLAMRSLVLGGDPADCALIERLFREHSHVTGPMRTAPGLDAVAAAFLKYQENCFLALKVSFMNEFFDAFAASGSDTSWDDLQTAFHLDHERMGSTHWHVPGPDGKRGWGGACLPKDVASIRAWAAERGVPMPLMEAATRRNLTDREEG